MTSDTLSARAAGVWMAKAKPYWRIAAVLAITFAVSSWVIRPENGFTFDDFTFLNKSMFDTYESIFSLLPRTRYNDRPIGWIFIKFLYGFHGLDPVGYHVVYLLLHLFNTFLVWRVALRIAGDVGVRRAADFAAFSAAFFGLWTKSLMSVQWISAIFDLLGCTLFLLIVSLYLENRGESRYRTFNTGLMLALFFLGLRTKEMIILTPACLFLYEAADLYSRWARQPRSPKAGFALPALMARFRMILVLAGLMLGYFAYLFFILPDGGTTDVTSPYFMSFSPRVLLINAAKYVALHFEYIDHGFVFQRVTAASAAGLGVAAGILALAVHRLVRRRSPWLIAGGLTAFLMLAPVLPMKNMQHILYLYIPGVPIALMMGGIAAGAIAWLASARARTIASLGIVAALAMLSLSPGIVGFRAMWLEYCRKDRVAMADIATLQKPEANATVHVVSETDAYNVFFYGPGFVNTVVFGDNTIRTVTGLRRQPEPEALKAPYLVLDYDEKTGHVREIRRS